MAAAGSNNADQIPITTTAQLYIASPSVTLPAAYSETLTSAWYNVGYVKEDGVKFTTDREVTTVKSLQSFRPTLMKVTGMSEKVAFDVQQWNDVTFQLAFGGGTITSLGGGQYQYNFPTPQTAVEWAIILDQTVGAYTYRWIAPRGIVTNSIETTMARKEESTLPIEFSLFAEAPYVITNDPSFAVDS